MTLENQKRCLLAGFVTLALVVGFASCANDTGQKKAEEKTSSSDTTTVQQAPAVTDTASSHDTTTTVGTTKPVKKLRKGKASAAYAMAPGSKVEKGKDGIYVVADKMPEYPGGEEALSKFVEQHINYPQTAVEDDTEGTITVSFVVDETGKVMNPMPIGNAAGHGLAEEAVRVVKQMPAWHPGTVKGTPVKTRLSLPVTFKLD